jgi:hypothetical protein
MIEWDSAIKLIRLKCKIMKKRFLLLGVLFICGVSALAKAETAITADGARAWESPPKVTTGSAYMTLTNAGGEIDRLVTISGEVAETIELHHHIMKNGTMMMRPMESIEIKPGESVAFEPGGLHIMLIDLKAPLLAGQDFPLTLHFEKAGEVVVEVAVEKR